MRFALCVAVVVLAAACYPVPQSSVARCPAYEGQRLVTSRIRPSTGETSCVYAPEEKRR